MSKNMKNFLNKINNKIFTNKQLTTAEEIACESILNSSAIIDIEHIEFCWDIELCDIIRKGPKSLSIADRMMYEIRIAKKFKMSFRYHWLYHEISKYVWDCINNNKTDDLIIFKSKNKEIKVSLISQEVTLYKNGECFKKELTSNIINSMLNSMLK